MTLTVLDSIVVLGGRLSVDGTLNIEGTTYVTSPGRLSVHGTVNMKGNITWAGTSLGGDGQIVIYGTFNTTTPSGQVSRVDILSGLHVQIFSRFLYQWMSLECGVSLVVEEGGSLECVGAGAHACSIVTIDADCMSWINLEWYCLTYFSCVSSIVNRGEMLAQGNVQGLSIVHMAFENFGTFLVNSNSNFRLDISNVFGDHYNDFEKKSCGIWNHGVFIVHADELRGVNIYACNVINSGDLIFHANRLPPNSETSFQVISISAGKIELRGRLVISLDIDFSGLGRE